MSVHRKRGCVLGRGFLGLCWASTKFICPISTCMSPRPQIIRNCKVAHSVMVAQSPSQPIQICTLEGTKTRPEARHRSFEDLDSFVGRLCFAMLFLPILHFPSLCNWRQVFEFTIQKHVEKLSKLAFGSEKFNTVGPICDRDTFYLGSVWAIHQKPISKLGPQHHLNQASTKATQQAMLILVF